MRPVLRLAAFALAFALAPAQGALAKPKDCRAGALEQLRQASPGGYSIYGLIKDKAFFTKWISCGEPQLGLPTAVHESVHMISADQGAYPLLGGGSARHPADASKFFHPAKIAGKFKPNVFVQTYLRPGGASSATEFLYLLDELNAYTHDLASAVDLSRAGLTSPGVDNRDGLAALMAFTALYAQQAEEREPATWTGLQKPEVSRVVAELWTRAETTMASSCRIPNFGTEDKAFLSQACVAKAQASLEKIIGRAPVCPTECLQVRVSNRAP